MSDSKAKGRESAHASATGEQPFARIVIALTPGQVDLMEKVGEGK